MIAAKRARSQAGRQPPRRRPSPSKNMEFGEDASCPRSWRRGCGKLAEEIRRALALPQRHQGARGQRPRPDAGRHHARQRNTVRGPPSRLRKFSPMFTKPTETITLDGEGDPAVTQATSSPEPDSQELAKRLTSIIDYVRDCERRVNSRARSWTCRGSIKTWSRSATPW